MKACAICDDRTSLLTCKHVGPICFDCLGSGIHEVMKRNIAVLTAGLLRLEKAFYGSRAEVPPDRPVCPKCGSWRQVWRTSSHGGVYWCHRAGCHQEVWS